MLHDRIIDRLCRRASERIGIDVQHRPIVDGALDRLARRLENRRDERRHLLAPGARRGEENARVPIIAALGEHRLRLFERRLLDEMRDIAHASARRRRNIAKARRGMIGLDPEGDDPPCRGRRSRRLDRGVERGDIGNMMIARADQQQFVGIRRRRRQPDRRRAVALDRLEQQPRAIGRQRPQIRFLRTVGDDHRGGKASAEPRQRRLEQALCAEQRQQMLGPRRRRQRPQPRSRPARQDYWADQPPHLISVHPSPMRENEAIAPAFTIYL